MISTADRLSSGCSCSSGWSMPTLWLISADNASVIWSAYGLDAATACWALMIREVAIISWARVILAVDLTDLIRCRSWRTCAAIYASVLLDVAADALDGLLLHGLLVDRL